MVKMSYYGNTRSIIINQRDQVESSGQESYVYDQDGFLAQHNRETYEYDSFGRLLRAFEPGRYDIRYLYDARHQLVARKDFLTGQLVQFFYGDVRHADRGAPFLQPPPKPNPKILHYQQLPGRDTEQRRKRSEAD